MRSSFLFLFLAVTSLTLAANRTNVIIVMPDDASFNDFSYYTPEAPRTPHIDTLAQTSVQLTDFHVSPTCSPTRASLLTGRYSNATGVWHTILGRQILRKNERTMAEVFRSNGYQTGLFGKWHLGEAYPYRPQDRGFQHVVRHHGGGTGQQPDHWGNSNLVPSTYYIDDQPVALADEDDGIPGGFATNFFTGRAIDWMQSRLDDDEPFLAYLPFNVAHAPQDFPPDARAGTTARSATIENLDKNTGRLLRFLHESGAEDNTLLLFFTDNGGPSNLQGTKGSVFEGGHRVPCFLRWPQGGFGGPEAQRFEVSGLSAHIDVLPTLIDLLKLRDNRRDTPNIPLHGTSLRPWLTSSPPQPPTVLPRVVVIDNQRLDHLEKYKQACVMRDEFDRDGSLHHKWRLIRDSVDTPWQLFDVQADPRERRDLADMSPALRSIATGLASAYELWWVETSPRAAEYARAYLGAAGHREVTLYAHDWHTVAPADAHDSEANYIHNGTGVPWNQMLIAQGPANFGFHAVDVIRAGSYRFDLRRWPREIATTTSLTSGLPHPVRDGPGQPLPIASARLRLWQENKVIADVRQTVNPDADQVSFELPKVPLGPAFLQTWFFDPEGRELCGAYYTDVEGPQ